LHVGVVALHVGFVTIDARLVAQVISVAAHLGDVIALVMRCVTPRSDLIALDSSLIAFFRRPRPTQPRSTGTILIDQTRPPTHREAIVRAPLAGFYSVVLGLRRAPSSGIERGSREL
jgi:hypothetical protein